MDTSNGHIFVFIALIPIFIISITGNINASNLETYELVKNIHIEQILSIDLEEQKIQGVGADGTVFDIKFTRNSELKLIQSDKDSIEYTATGVGSDTSELSYKQTSNSNPVIYYTTENPADKIILKTQKEPEKEADVVGAAAKGYVIYKMMNKAFQ